MIINTIQTKIIYKKQQKKHKTAEKASYLTFTHIHISPLFASADERFFVMTIIFDVGALFFFKNGIFFLTDVDILINVSL